MNATKKWACLGVLAVMLALGVTARGGDISVKYGGPSGQGQLIYWCPATGITNLVFDTNGIATLNLADGTIVTGAVLTVTRQTVAVGTNIEHATRLDALDAVTPSFGDAWTNATAAVTVIGGDAVVTNATLTLEYSGTLYDSTGAALTNDAGNEVSIVTNATLLLETGAVTATSALTPETGDFVSGITSNVITPLNTVTLQTVPVAAVTDVTITVQSP